MGGTAVEGIAIYSSLKNTGKTTKVFTEGNVASAGIMFCCGADEVIVNSIDILKIIPLNGQKLKAIKMRLKN